MRKIALTVLAVIYCLCPRAFAETGVIQFDFESLYADIDASGDLSWDAIGRPFYAEIDEAEWGVPAGKYLIGDFAIPLMSGDEYRAILTCSSLDRNYACLGIQLSVIDERATPASVVQSFELGDGYAPEIIAARGDAYNVMFRTIRAGDNTEAYVYSINPLNGRMDLKLAITRNLPERMGLEVTGTLKPGGVIDVASERPPVRATIDMAEALDSLIEDEIYHPSGNPINAFVNLRLIRGGWEDEDLYRAGAETRVSAGMTLMTLSLKPVVDVTAVLKPDPDGNWAVTEMRFEPAMPYRSE